MPNPTIIITRQRLETIKIDILCMPVLYFLALIAAIMSKFLTRIPFRVIVLETVTLQPFSPAKQIRWTDVRTKPIAPPVSSCQINIFTQMHCWCKPLRTYGKGISTQCTADWVFRPTNEKIQCAAMLQVIIVALVQNNIGLHLQELCRSVLRAVVIHEYLIIDHTSILPNLVKTELRVKQCIETDDAN